MALQTEHVHLAHFEEPRIGGTVGRVASGAALGLHRHMLVHERPLLVGMALVANGIAARQGSRLPHARRPVDVMAVVALDQALVYAMVKGLGKVALRVLVAAVTQVWFLFGKQGLRLGGMHAVTIDAGHARAGMLAPIEVHLVRALGVAVQTDTEDLTCFDFSQARDLAPVSSSIDVGRTGPMANFAAFSAGLLLYAKNAGMRRRLHHAGLVRMADLALFAADICCSGSGQHWCGYWLLRTGSAVLSSRRQGVGGHR